MQERVSQLLQFRPGEIGPVFKPGTIVFINEAAMGIIKVVAGSGFPGQVKDQVEIWAGSRPRKTYQVSLLGCELEHRDLRSAVGQGQETTAKARTQGSSGVLEDLHFSSTEQLWHHS